MIAVFQTRSQIDDMLGRDKAHTLIGAAKVMLILPGIRESGFIQELSHVSGQKFFELNEDSLTPQPLIDGTYLTRMLPPSMIDGEPGDAVMMVEGAPIEVKIPIWSLEDEFYDRGTVPEDRVEWTEELRGAKKDTWDRHRDNATKKAKGYWSAAVGKVQSRYAAPLIPETPPTPTAPFVAAPITRMPVRSVIRMPVRSVGCAARIVNTETAEVLTCGQNGYLCQTCVRDQNTASASKSQDAPDGRLF
jgi:hypothetical protein